MEYGNSETPGLTALFEQVNRDPGMTDIYIAYLSAFLNASVFSESNPFMSFSSTGQYTKYGSWGLFEFTGQPLQSSPKYMALRQFFNLINDSKPCVNNISNDLIFKGYPAVTSPRQADIWIAGVTHRIEWFISADKVYPSKFVSIYLLSDDQCDANPKLIIASNVMFLQGYFDWYINSTIDFNNKKYFIQIRSNLNLQYYISDPFIIYNNKIVNKVDAVWSCSKPLPIKSINSCTVFDSFEFYNPLYRNSSWSSISNTGLLNADCLNSYPQSWGFGSCAVGSDGCHYIRTKVGFFPIVDCVANVSPFMQLSNDSLVMLPNTPNSAKWKVSKLTSSQCSNLILSMRNITSSLFTSACVYDSVSPTSIPTSAPSSISFVPSYTKSFTPSKSPTLLPTTISPTMKPSLIPTVVDTTIPSVVSTLVPTVIATKLPSFKPTNIPPTKKPNNLPIAQSTFIPTIVPIQLVPTAEPTTEVPTYIPTPLPQPVVSFITSMKVQGLPNGCSSMNDSTTQATILKAQSIVMNISVSSLKYQDCKTTRRLHNFNKVMQSGYSIGTKVTVTTNTTSSESTDATTSATNLFNKLTTALQAAVSNNGSFAAVLQKAAMASGKGNSTFKSFKVTGSSTSDLAVVVYTYRPTGSPTLKPSARPSLEPTIEPTYEPTVEGSYKPPTLAPTMSNKPSSFSIGTIEIIIGASVLFFIIMVGVIVVLYRRRTKQAAVYPHYTNVDVQINSDQVSDFQQD